MSAATAVRRTALRVLRGLALLFALLLSFAIVLVVPAIPGQLERDQECRTQLAAHLRKLEAYRARTGRFPRSIELSVPSTRMHLIGVWTMESEPEELRRRGATADGDYMLTFKRSQSFESYLSWAPEDICDGGNRAFAYAFPSIMIPLAGLMFWLALRRWKRAERSDSA